MIGSARYDAALWQSSRRTRCKTATESDSAADGVTFGVQHSELFGLLGSDGARKTTTMWLGDLENVLFNATGQSLYE